MHVDNVAVYLIIVLFILLKYSSTGLVFCAVIVAHPSLHNPGFRTH